MRIEILAGSPREKSVTRRVAKHLHSRLLETTGHQVGLIDLVDWDLPPVQNVFTSPENAPEEFKPLAERIFQADAFVLVSPEYNGSYSPTLKNLLDHFPKQHRKPFGIVTASPGPLGGMRAAQQLLLLVPALFGIPSPYLLIIPAVEKKFDEEGNLTELTFENNIHNFLSEFLWLGENLARNKKEVVAA